MAFLESFEAERWHHRVKVFPDGAAAYDAEIGNIFTPENWVFWFRHKAGTWDQPEAHFCWRSGDPNRIRTGDGAYMYFTFCRKHDAGLMRQVQVGQGKALRLTAYAHAWSNHQDSSRPDAFPHPDDPRWSDGAGHQEIAWRADLPVELTGDPQEDARWNVSLVVGIDPTGGTNPMASTVVWGTGYYVYNGYCQQLSVEATSAAEVVTVFLRSVTRWAFKHNDAYWDDVELAVEGGGPVPGRGAPRVDYERTYVLLPPDSTLEEATATLRANFEARRTIGFSADDAGIGDLSIRKVVAVRPGAWPTSLPAFFEQYYPGVEYVPVNDSGVLRLAYPTTHQPARITGRFGDQRPTYIHKGLDLRSSWAQWGDEVVCALSGEVIAAGCLASDKSFGYQVQVRTAVDGDVIMVRYAHMVAGGIYVKTGDWVQTGQRLGRPDSTGVSTADHLHIDVRKNGKYINPEPLIDWPETGPAPSPEPNPGPRTTRGHVGLHLQSMAAGWDKFVCDLRPSVIKVLASMQDVVGVKRACPATTAIWRHVDNNYGGILDAADPLVGARRWVDKFRDSLYEVCARMGQEFPGLRAPYFFVESINEVYSSDLAVVLQARNFDMAFIDALAETGLPVAPAVFTAAVGNPHESQFELLVPLAAKCQTAGGLMSYHNYWLAEDGVSKCESDWPYRGGRWAEMDRVFCASGVRVQWYGGESGAYSDCANGWRSKLCYDGNWEKYLADLLWADNWIREWNKANGDRFLGFVLFTTGAPYMGWGSFQIQAAEMAALSQALQAQYT